MLWDVYGSLPGSYMATALVGLFAFRTYWRLPHAVGAVHDTANGRLGEASKIMPVLILLAILIPSLLSVICSVEISIYTLLP